MGRPKIPLVERTEVITTALGIIDSEGLAALSLRRLGTELGVTGAALYHHFADKEEILRGVAELVITREVIPRMVGATWEEYVLQSVQRYRKALLAHPNAAPLMQPHGQQALNNLPREYIVTLMLEAGVPEHLCYPILDSMELMAFASAMMNPRNLPAQERLEVHGRNQTNLRKILKATLKSAEQLFQLELEALMTGWKTLIENE
ncbi:TetR/AcrR family transcriptional regulator [Nocardia bovistercoris]|uniref:Helix-turn-helix transcriptional regulator n=1 Tax=Nocardia bovistercoris TaxID=2785916 RepID=A0A931I8F6_9NOCA|nr:TetR family transcriptional regulator [Nocardia bovistercoris]MBH0775285.1 helix-turn-helix transcriptional regulator [Nocardia bovistercoris]